MILDIVSVINQCCLQLFIHVFGNNASANMENVKTRRHNFMVQPVEHVSFPSYDVTRRIKHSFISLVVMLPSSFSFYIVR